MGIFEFVFKTEVFYINIVLLLLLYFICIIFTIVIRNLMIIFDIENISTGYKEACQVILYVLYTFMLGLHDTLHVIVMRISSVKTVL